MRKRMWKNVQIRTYVFLGFLLGFLILLTGLTYYSHVAYVKSLPRVTTVKPERTDSYKNGRCLYALPERVIQKTMYNGRLTLCIYTARYCNDILGERYLVTLIPVSVEEELGEGMVLVDGIVDAEPVLTENPDQFCDGQAVLLGDDAE